MAVIKFIEGPKHLPQSTKWYHNWNDGQKIQQGCSIPPDAQDSSANNVETGFKMTQCESEAWEVGIKKRKIVVTSQEHSFHLGITRPFMVFMSVS